MLRDGLEILRASLGMALYVVRKRDWDRMVAVVIPNPLKGHRLT